MLVTISEAMLARTRHFLRQALPGARSSQVAEALAAALGFRTSIALNAWLSDPGRDPLRPREMCFRRFARRISDIAHETIEFVEETPRFPDEGTIPEGLFDPGRPERLVEAILAATRKSLRVGEEPTPWLGDHRADALRWAERAERIARIAVDHMLRLHVEAGGAFDAYALSRCMGLDTILALADDATGIASPPEARARAAEYVGSLPFRADRPMVRLDQHGYAQMQLQGRLPGISPGGSATLLGPGVVIRVEMLYRVPEAASERERFRREAHEALREMPGGMAWRVATFNSATAIERDASYPIVFMADRPSRRAEAAVA